MGVWGVYVGCGEGVGTTEDGLFPVEPVMCLAACDKAPVLQCNFPHHENLDLERSRCSAGSGGPKRAGTTAGTGDAGRWPQATSSIW